MRLKFRAVVSALAISTGHVALAADSLPFAASSAASVPTPVGGTLRIAVAMVLVLGALLGAAWFSRRVRGTSGSATNGIAVLAQVSLGTRERAVLLRVGAQQVLVGVAPGNVRTLHVLDDGIAASASPGIESTADADAEAQRPSFKSMLLKSLGK